MSKKTKNFEVDARTILQLGRDSIKDHTTALAELVKNSYDADANIVNVEIKCLDENETSHFIRVSDNGFGMDEKTIDDNWLRIGYSEKKIKKKSAIGRRKTGEKGIGRIAADRLGEILILKSKSKNESPYGLKVDWSDFDVDGVNLSDVEIDVLENVSPKLPKNDKSGTEILIKKLRQSWSEENIYDLKAELSTLVSPFSQISDFKIILDTDIVDGLENMSLDSSFLDAAEIELEVEYDGKTNILDYYIDDRQYKINSIEHIPIKNLINEIDIHNQNSLPCGPFKIKLLFFTRDNSSLRRSNFHKLGDFKKALDEYKGVKIYRDGIAVKPYGFKNSSMSDWLGLANRKAKNPAGLSRSSYKITPNQLIGAVFIKRDDNGELHDSSSREGLVENDAYKILKHVAVKSIEILEGHRHKMASNIKKVTNNKAEHVVSTSKTFRINTISDSLSSVEQDIKNLSNSAKKDGVESLSLNDYLTNTLDKAATKVKRQQNNLVEVTEELLDENRVLGGLATLGISSAVFGHEIQSTIALLRQATKNALDVAKIDYKKDKILTNSLTRSYKYSQMIAGWGNFSLARVSMSKRKNPKIQRVDIIVKDAIVGILPAFEASQVELIMKLDKVMSKVYPMNIEALLFNLLTNAYKACKEVSKNRKIEVIIESNCKLENLVGYKLIISDSGPGIATEFAEKIWEPLFSTKVKGSKELGEGTGLGLTIVDSVASEMNGKIEVILKNDKKLGGATFSIWLPKKM